MTTYKRESKLVTRDRLELLCYSTHMNDIAKTVKELLGNLLQELRDEQKSFVNDMKEYGEDE